MVGRAADAGNILRKTLHKVLVLQKKIISDLTVFIRRDYEQYPEGICGEMCGDCMNCPLPENMRAGCVQSINGKPRTNVCTREDPFS